MGRARHFLAAVGWVIGSFIAWGVVCNLFGYVVFMYLGNERGLPIPGWTVAAFNWGAIAGVLLIPPIVAVPAIRGKLPGTRARVSNRGFPVVMNRTGE